MEKEKKLLYRVFDPILKNVYDELGKDKNPPESLHIFKFYFIALFFIFIFTLLLFIIF